MQKTIIALVMTLLLSQAVMAAPQAKQDAAISTSINQLGYQLLGKLANKHNLIISPLSIFEALSLAREGSNGDTLKEFDQCMHLKTSPVSDLTALNGELARGSAKLDIANAIFAKKQFVLASQYLDSVKPLGAVRSIVFDDKAAAIINSYVASKTNERIKKVVAQVRSSDRLFIVNAVYFKNKWQLPFAPEATNAGVFNGVSKIPVKMMHHTSIYDYYQDSQMQVISLPYQGNCEMRIYLPRTSDPINLLGKLEANQAITLEQQKVNLTLPKFVIEGSENLEQKLPQLGLKKAFLADQADFGKMTGAKGQSKNNEPLYIGQILHKTFLEVDEAGTEAAAVTVISIPGGAAPSPTKPVEMVVDRPFVLTIRDRQSNTNLFVGLVYDPKQK